MKKIVAKRSPRRGRLAEYVCRPRNEGAELAEERALRRACIGALKTGTLPATFRAMVTRRETETQAYRRVAYRIERRTIVMKVTPAPGARASDLREPPEPAAVDPWGCEPTALPSATAVLTVCLTCVGVKKIACPACAATGQVRCYPCGGGGKVSGQRGPKNCPSCRGTGRTKCANCSKGMVKCGPCDGVGRVRAWLEVQAQQSVQVRAHPETGIATLHAQRLSVADFDSPPASLRVPLVQDSQWIDALPEALGPELTPTLAPLTDRVIGQRIQRFESRVYKFTFATRTAEGTIAMSGEPPALLQGSTWGPLWRRLALAVAVGALMFVVGAVVAGHYAERAEWFRTQGNAGRIMLLTLVGAVAAGATAAGRWLPSRVRPRLQRSPALWALSSAWLLIGVLWHVGGPGIEAVRAALERGDLAAAQAELQAMQVIEGPSARVAVEASRLAAAQLEAQRRRDVATDQAHLNDVRNADSARIALHRLGLPWMTKDIELEARDVALRRAHDDLLRLSQAADEGELTRLASDVATLDPELAVQARARAHLARASVLTKRGDFAGALAALKGWTGDAAVETMRAGLQKSIEEDLRRSVEEAPLEAGSLVAQRQTIELALTHARMFETLTRERASHTSESLQARLERVDKSLAREEKIAAEAERKRLAVEARARKKAEQAERQRLTTEASAAARSARAADRVGCCDGTMSPSCRYSQGSLRGCCSHHGGVC